MTCTHLFVIPPPDGRELLPGRCRKCGQVREFKASWDATVYIRYYRRGATAIKEAV